MKYQGSCHCRQICFEVEGDLQQVTECNCSICSKRGALMWFVPKVDFHLLTPVENYVTYTFNTHKIKHRICPNCGCTPFEEALDAKGLQTVAINVRCLDDADLSTLKVAQFNGKKL
jgi:hypothetical protein